MRAAGHGSEGPEVKHAADRRRPEWAIVIQALVFGAWHLGLGYTNTGGAGLLPAVAITIVHQATIGLAFGIVFERTRSILAPSVAHILANSMG